MAVNENVSRARAVAARLPAVPSDDDADILAEYPDVRENLVAWLSAAAKSDAGEWATELANLVGRVGASEPRWVEGASPILNDLLRVPPTGLNEEDVVEVIGEIRADQCVETLVAVAWRWRKLDAPMFWLSKKVLWSLSVIESAGADDALRTISGVDWPLTVRALAVDELVHARGMDRREGLDRLVEIFRASADASASDPTTMMNIIEVIAAIETPEATAFVESPTAEGWPQSVRDFARDLV